MATATVLNKQLDIIKLRYTTKQKQIAEATIEVSPLQLDAQPFDVFLENCTIEHNGTIILSGVVSDLPKIDVDKGTTTINVDGALGLLDTEASANVHFQNVPVSTAISTILSYTRDSTWALNNTSSLTESNITLDVRSKKTIWANCAKF